METEKTKKIECPKELKLPEIGDKNLAIFVLGVIAGISMFVLKADSTAIVTGCLGVIGGVVVGDKLPKKADK